MSDFTRNGEGKENDLTGISRQLGEVGIIFVDFLEYYETAQHSLPLAVRAFFFDLEQFCCNRNLEEVKAIHLKNLAHMYVHKILLPKVKQMKREGEGKFP